MVPMNKNVTHKSELNKFFPFPDTVLSDLLSTQSQQKTFISGNS